MKKNVSMYVMSLLFVFSFWVGCGIQTDPKIVLENTTTNLTNASGKIVNAINTIQNLDEFKSMFTNFDSVRNIENEKIEKFQPPNQQIEPVKSSDIKEMLEKYILVAESLVKQDSTGLTYQIKGSVICQAFIPKEDKDYQQCVTDIDNINAQLLIVQEDADTVIAKLSINGGNPALELSVSSKQIKLQFNLEAIQIALKHISTVMKALNEDLRKGLPTVAKGSVSLALDYSADPKVSFSIESDVSIEGTIEGEKYKLELSKQDSVLSVLYNLSLKKVAMALNASVLKALVPAKALFKDEKGSAELFLAGLSASFTLEEKKEIEIKNIGLGKQASWLKLNGKTLANVDLNANNNRVFDLKIKDTNGMPEISVSPALDVKATVDMTSLTSIKPEDKMGAWAYGETIQILLGNSGAASTILPVKGNNPIVKVLKGTLTMKNVTQSKEVTTLEGLCMSFKREVSGTDDSFLGHFSSVACP